tara:strand:- start:3643 stop:4077 length:435 start_codon:yes stop_codon:yes gene_type:complete
MKKLDSFRIDEKLLTRLKEKCIRYGDKTWHIETALEEYLDRLDSKQKPKKKAVKKETVFNDFGFNSFWEAYPTSVGKKMAIKAWVKIGPNDELRQVIIKDVKRRVSTGEWCDPQYIPHGSTYLNQERWNDAPAKVVPMSKGAAL